MSLPANHVQREPEIRGHQKFQVQFTETGIFFHYFNVDDDTFNQSKFKQPMTELTYVAPSGIHGLGLFAAKKIDKNCVIGWLKGKPSTRDGSYVLWLNDEEGFEVSCNLRYINHSNQPNACYYNDLSVVALRDIEPGEEITHDYGDAHW